jgi:hypothetical protein
MPPLIRDKPAALYCQRFIFIRSLTILLLLSELTTSPGAIAQDTDVKPPGGDDVRSNNNNADAPMIQAGQVVRRTRIKRTRRG